MANLLQDTANFIVPFCRYQAANIGTNNMPLIGIANIVRNAILAAPFTWRFNRNNVALVGVNGIQANVQDYVQTVSDMGFIEKATANDGTTSWEFKDVKNNDALAASVTPGRPLSISIFNDGGNGVFTFRLSAVPDQAYSINMVYQKAPVQFVSVSDPWSPIPDSFSDVYNNWCLGYYMDSCQDPRAPQYIARGVAGLLARATGLTETDKAVFAAAYLRYDSSVMTDLARRQQGIQAQGAK